MSIVSLPKTGKELRDLRRFFERNIGDGGYIDDVVEIVLTKDQLALLCVVIDYLLEDRC